MRLILIAALIAVLSGCALLRPRDELPGQPVDGPQAPAWQARVAQLSPIDRFVLKGRVASGALGFKADLRWKQHPDGRFELRLAGPFGARAAELAGDAIEVRVRTGDDQPIVTTDPEAWLQQALGVRLPVRGLRWWALGLPAPDARSEVRLDPQTGRALRIVQNGWELNYVEYRPASADGAGPQLPRRIEARNGDTQVLVLADQWTQLPVGVSTPAAVP
ncbi:MAG: lolB [Panacagrimonas sp.]|jgi:outer membrane lipoprotein LolB|nr:lipoprotein insertase outer membrane protein LolB [Panacagrimonas sp.]MCC2655449.1 lolB [Panacagrimonas sp.]